MANIHLIRHGQANFSGDVYDQLSTLGQQQSALAGVWLARHGAVPQCVYAGTLQRQQHSAQAALQAAGLQAPLHTLAALDEFDHQNVLACHRAGLGTVAGLKAWLATQAEPPHAAFQRVFEAAMQQWLAVPDAEAVTQGYRESWHAFQRRCQTALHTIMADNHGAAHVWVFSSGGPIAAICQHLLHMDDAATLALSWRMVNSSSTRLVWRTTAAGVQANVLVLNSFAHLEHDATLITFR